MPLNFNFDTHYSRTLRNTNILETCNITLLTLTVFYYIQYTCFTCVNNTPYCYFMVYINSIDEFVLTRMFCLQVNYYIEL